MAPATLITAVADTTSHRDRDAIDRAMVKLVVEFLPAASVTLYDLLDDEGTKRLTPTVSLIEGGQVQTIQPDDAAAQGVELAAMPLWKECVERQRSVEYEEGDGSLSCAWPLAAERGTIGLLVARGVNASAVRDRDLVAGILRIQRNHLAVLDYGERDTLTGMLNRKTFEASFAKIRQRLCNADRSSAAREPSWLGMADIDKFKSINDSHGHLFGDEVLLLVAQVMTRCFRGADQLFRFGGEEFLIVLDHATETGAQIAYDRFRRAVEEFPFPQVGRVTISVGYSRIKATDTPSTCVERADSALYYAKHHGRNHVRHFEELIADGALTPRHEGGDSELF